MRTPPKARNAPLSGRFANLALSGLVALAVSVTVSGANPTSSSDKHGISTAALSAEPLSLATLEARVEYLEANDLTTRVKIRRAQRTADQAIQDAADARASADCVDGAIGVAWDGDAIVTTNADTNPDGFWIASFDPTCEPPVGS